MDVRSDGPFRVYRPFRDPGLGSDIPSGQGESSVSSACRMVNRYIRDCRLCRNALRGMDFRPLLRRKDPQDVRCGNVPSCHMSRNPVLYTGIGKCGVCSRTPCPCRLLPLRPASSAGSRSYQTGDEEGSIICGGPHRLRKLPFCNLHRSGIGMVFG